jgi:hypothetical protein
MKPTRAQQACLEAAPFNGDSDVSMQAVAACVRRGWLLKQWHDERLRTAEWVLTDAGRAARARGRADQTARRGETPMDTGETEPSGTPIRPAARQRFSE